MSLLQKFFIFFLISVSGLPIVVLNNGESLSCGHSLTQAYKISSYFLKHHVKAQKYQKVAYRHQFNLFDLRSETALNKDGGVEALSHVEDQQVGAIIQRPLATHVSLSINFGSYSQREFRKHKHKSRLQILPFVVVGKYQERVKSTHFCAKVFDNTPLSLLGRSPC